MIHDTSRPTTGSHIPGETSTGSKRCEALFGPDCPDDVPTRLVRSSGARIWDERGREFIDYVMGLGAVALGYGHPEVNRAASEAIAAGVVGPLPPLLEEEVAALLSQSLPWMEQVRFLKTGAEATLAAVRLARVHTGRDRVVTCGYHGWLDWCRSELGVPATVRALHEHIPFNDIDRSVACLRRLGPDLAAVVIEPVIDGEPDVEWLNRMRSETERLGAVLIFDEIKTAFRIALGGAAERYGVNPDLTVIGKALGNGFPLAAVGGRRDIMAGATKSWISSTLATEQVSLAAAKAVVGIMATERVPRRLAELGGRLYAGLRKLAERHPSVISAVRGMPEMCYLEFSDPPSGFGVVREAAAHGILWKRTAYNFVCVAHDPELIDRTLVVLEEAIRTVRDDTPKKGGSC